MGQANVKSEYKDETLFFDIYGDIDHHSAKGLREEMDRDICFYRAKTVIISFGSVDFMDSSGLGLILGRYNKIKELGGTLKLEGVSESILKIIKLAGVDKIIETTSDKRVKR